MNIVLNYKSVWYNVITFKYVGMPTKRLTAGSLFNITRNE